MIIIFENFNVFYYLIMCIAGYLISGYLHECGHIIVGCICGWKFKMLVVGPLGIRRTENKLKIYFEKNMKYWCGVGLAVPVKDVDNNLQIWKKVLLGGPLFSSVFGMIFMVSGISFEIDFLFVIGIMSFAIGMVCLIPCKTGILYSDGGRLFRLNKSNSNEQKEEIALFHLALNEWIKGHRKLTVNDIEILISSSDNSLKYYGLYYGYKYFTEIGNLEQMNQCKAEMLELEKNHKVSQVIINDCKSSF